MCLIEDYVRETSHMAAPEKLRRWSGVALVSGALSRRVWTSVLEDQPLYPNTYIVFVAKPGLGKDQAFGWVKECLRAVNSVALAPDKITQEKMLQDMGEVFHQNLAEGDKSYIAMLSELANFLKQGDISMMQALATLWNCPPIFEYKTKHQGEDTLHWPYLNILAGVQPAWFSQGMGSDALEMGFNARTIFIYCDEPVRLVYKQRDPNTKPRTFKTLLPAVHELSAVRGFVPFAPEALAMLQEWDDGGRQPWIERPALEGYAVRRNMHVCKLALLIALSRHPKEMEVGTSDLRDAMALLFDAEHDMHKALAGAGGNQFRLREEGVQHHVRALFERTKAPVPEWRVRRFLSQHAPPNTHDALIDSLIAQRALNVARGKAPERHFIPGGDM